MKRVGLIFWTFPLGLIAQEGRSVIDQIKIFNEKTAVGFSAATGLFSEKTFTHSPPNAVATESIQDSRFAAPAGVDVLRTFNIKSGHIVNVWQEPCQTRPGLCSTTTYSFYSPGAEVTDFVPSLDGNGGLLAIDQRGLLHNFKYFWGFGFPDKDSPEFGVANASTIFLVRPGVVALSAPGRDRLFLYQISEDGRSIIISENNRLPKLGSGCSSLSWHPAGLLCTDAGRGELLFVARSSDNNQEYDWENPKVIYQEKNLVRATSDEKGRVFLALAGEGNGRVVMVEFSTGNILEIASNLDINFSVLGGLAARSGRVYVINNERNSAGRIIGSHILKYGVESPNQSFVYARIGDSLFIGLKFAN